MGRYKFLILILILGAVLRLVALGQYNPGFFRDEAAIGYNAYSIWETGRDEFGFKLPIVFRSFEVFFMPLYIYLLSPVVGIFGLNEFNVRVLSAIAGIFGILGIYLIVFQIWKNEKTALFSAFILTISPWHILYSRGAFEGNLALSLFIFGFLALLKFIEKSSVKNLSLAILFYILSMYSYQSERLVVPLLGLFAFILLFKKIKLLRLKLIIPVALAVFLMLPILSLTFQPGSYHRAFGTSIFSTESHVPGWEIGEPEGFIVNNSTFLRIRQFAALYLSYFSPRSLFFEGDANLQRGVENFSTFYSILFPALIIGFMLVFKDKRKELRLITAWILFAPVPAALTADPFHTYRSLLLYFPLTILITVGIFRIFKFLKFRIFSLLIFVVLLFDLSQFLYSYFVLTPAARARDWDYGYRQMVEFINTQTDYDKVVVDDEETEGYIHFLFFGKIDPAVYHQELGKLGPVENYYYSRADKIRPNNIGKIYFRKTAWALERGDNKTIFVFPAGKLYPSEYENDPKIKLLKVIYYPDKKVAYRILKIDKPPEETF